MRSQQKAEAFIRRLLETPSVSSGDRLPTVAKIAAMGGFSTATVCAALRELRKQRLVTAIPGKGILAGSPSAVLPPDHTLKWQKTRILCEKDIIENAFSADELPAVGDLMRRYGVSFVLMKKVLAALERDGVIYQHKRGFRIRRLYTRSYSALLFISCGSPAMGDMHIFNRRFTDVYNAVEDECARRNIKFCHTEVKPSESFAAAMLRKHQYMGYIVWSNGLLPGYFTPLAEELARIKKPSAIIDDLGVCRISTEAQNSGRIKIFTIGAVSAGRDVSRYLLGQGHRRIVFLSIHHGQLWSQWRLQGLKEHCRQTGYGTVAAVTLDDPPVSDAEPGKLYRPLADFINTVEPINRAGNYRYDPYLGLMYQTARTILDRERFHTLLAQLLDRVLRAPRPTAAVAANDYLAIIAVQYFRARGVRVPRDLALASFDNTQESHQYDISSYDFSFANLVRNALAWVISPSSAIFAGTPARIERPGIMIERKSTSCGRGRIE
jgi:DNA-binding LacI/PurR family transcriptional regulator